MIKLGSRVKDNYTGFEGIAGAHAKYLYGCNQFLIEPTHLDKDGDIMKGVWFDEQRVVLVKKEKPRVSKQNSAVSGGPQNTPTR